MKPPLHFSALAALAAAALLPACGQGSSPAAQVQTRPQALRVADADPAQVARMKTAVAPLLAQGPDDVVVTRAPNGVLHRQLKSGFSTVIIAHQGEDGRSTVSCVSSVDDVDQAMTASAPKAVR